MSIAIRVLLVSCALALLSAASHAASAAEGISFQTVFQAEKPVSIPVTSKPGDASIEFPAVVKQDGVLCLRFRAFLVTRKPAGWNPYLRIKLNGKPVTAYLGDGSERLINRGLFCETTIEGSVGWWEGTGNDTLFTFFGPADGPIDPRVISPRGEGYWYVLNISDGVNYVVVGADDRVESAKPNKLTFTNTYALLDSGETAVCREMRIDRVSVGYVPRDVVEKAQPLSSKPVPELQGSTLKTEGASLTLAPSGAMQIRIGKETCSISSGYSYPGDSIGYHEFTWQKTTDSDWKIGSLSAAGKNTVTLKGESKRFAVTRTVKARDGKFYVSDTIENRTDADLGMSIRYNAVLPSKFEDRGLYLCGNPDIRSTDACATNPTVFMRRSDGSLGIVVEDNVLRLQLGMVATGNSIRFGTEHFGLPAHEKYTVEWTLYPSADRDYFGFINRVRKDWKVNLTIPGPFAFSDGEVLANRKVLLYAVPPWFMYSTGSGMSEEEFKNVLQPKLAKLYTTQPGAISLGMIETNLIAVERKKTPGAEILPRKPETADRGTYGLELTAEQSKVLEKMPWFDCMLKTADGRPMIDTYYADKDYFDLMVYPAPGNYQLKYMLGQIDYLMDVVGFKGIYIDQFTLAVRGLGQRDRCDFSKWDGHTVDLNDRGEISRKYTDCALVGAKARAEIIRHIVRKGGTVVTNGHSVVRETTGLPCLNFQETEWTPFNPVEHLGDEPPFEGDMSAGHLDTPIGLGIRPSRFNEAGREHFAEIIHKWVITCLKNGQLYYYYESRIPTDGPGAGDYGVVNHMFPFTPEELHSGWLVGKERIITAVSGSYVWNHPDKPVCLVFDLKGRPRTPDVQMKKRGDAWDVSLKLADWVETAVIKSAAEK